MRCGVVGGVGGDFRSEEALVADWAHEALANVPAVELVKEAAGGAGSPECCSLAISDVRCGGGGEGDAETIVEVFLEVAIGEEAEGVGDALEGVLGAGDGGDGLVRVEDEG